MNIHYSHTLEVFLYLYFKVLLLFGHQLIPSIVPGDDILKSACHSEGCWDLAPELPLRLLLKCESLGLTPELLNQVIWRCGTKTCLFNRLPGISDSKYSVCTTDLQYFLSSCDKHLKESTPNDRFTDYVNRKKEKKEKKSEFLIRWVSSILLRGLGLYLSLWYY